MAKYKIIGPRPVAGADPGKTVELDLPEANIAALIAAGHVARVAVRPAEPPVEWGTAIAEPEIEADREAVLGPRKKKVAR